MYAIIIISNYTVFLVQFGYNLHLGVFQKAEIALTKAARAISGFLSNGSLKKESTMCKECKKVLTFVRLCYCCVIPLIGSINKLYQNVR